MQGPLMMPLVRLLRQAVNKLSIWMLFPSLILLEMGGENVPFSIKLVNCVLDRVDKSLPGWKQFQVTFDGHADGEMFGISGGPLALR